MKAVFRMVAVVVVWAVACCVVRAAEPAAAELQESQIQQRIERYRTATVTLTLTDAAGKPLVNQALEVRQVAHKFLFGCNGFGINDKSSLGDDYRQRFAALFNYATLPFYWGNYEPQPDQTGAQGLREMAQWCQTQGIRPKGHPLVWHNIPPGWMAGKSWQEYEARLMARIRREVTGFAGLIDTWDCVNEPMDMDKEDGLLGAVAHARSVLNVVKESFAEARKVPGERMLILNDYNNSPKYEKFIGECLKDGVCIDAIGLQSHMHNGYWGSRKIWDLCTRFEKFGTPLHFTEITLVSGVGNYKIKGWNAQHDDWISTPEGEQRQARDAAEFYRILFSHPAVAAITWWDFSDRYAWLGAPAGLLRKDMTPKPAYEALHKLIKQDWWTGPQTLTTDAQGSVCFHGFLGRYAVTAAGKTSSFDVPTAGKAQATATVR